MVAAPARRDQRTAGTSWRATGDQSGTGARRGKRERLDNEGEKAQLQSLQSRDFLEDLCLKFPLTEKEKTNLSYCLSFDECRAADSTAERQVFVVSAR